MAPSLRCEDSALTSQQRLYIGSSLTGGVCRGVVKWCVSDHSHSERFTALSIRLLTDLPKHFLSHTPARPFLLLPHSSATKLLC